MQHIRPMLVFIPILTCPVCCCRVVSYAAAARHQPISGCQVHDKSVGPGKQFFVYQANRPGRVVSADNTEQIFFRLRPDWPYIALLAEVLPVASMPSPVTMPNAAAHIQCTSECAPYSGDTSCSASTCNVPRMLMESPQEQSGLRGTWFLQYLQILEGEGKN